MTIKALCAGAGLALVAGLTMGAAMKPNLAADDRPEGPQAVADWSQAPTGPFDDGAAASFAAYQHQIPDYVTGTDWKKMTAAPASQTAYTAPVPKTDDDYPDTYTAPATYAELAGTDAAAEVSFPSRDGGTRYDSAAAPAPSKPASHFDDDVAPEATGDTTPAQS